MCAVIPAADILIEIAIEGNPTIDPYLNVLTAQTTLLSNQQTAVSLRIQQMTASGSLIESLGGGWEASQLPSPSQLISKVP